MGGSNSITEWSVNAAKRTKTTMKASTVDSEPTIEGDTEIKQYDDFQDS